MIVTDERYKFHLSRFVGTNVFAIVSVERNRADTTQHITSPGLHTSGLLSGSTKHTRNRNTTAIPPPYFSLPCSS
jgi:hypothetical protein